MLTPCCGEKYCGRPNANQDEEKPPTTRTSLAWGPGTSAVAAKPS